MNIFQKFLIFIWCGLLATWFFRAYARENTSTYLKVLSGQTVLLKSQESVNYDQILIEEGGSLIIEPDVQVHVGEHAQVKVMGTLKAHGTEKEPVIFSASHYLKPWQNLIAQGDVAEIDLSQVHFLAFSEPIKILTRHFLLDHFTLQDGQTNLLEIGSNTMSADTLAVGPVYVVNRMLGSGMKRSGVTIHTNFNHLEQKAYLDDSRPSDKVNWAATGIWLDGTAVTSSISYSLPHFCHPVIEIMSQGFFITSKGQECNNAVVPLVFVPGFGSSLNLSVLTHEPVANPSLTGWRFLYSLDPAYRTFLNMVRDNHIPYTVAFYDWRLPAAEAAENYLEPVIKQVKQKYWEHKVNIVAHSFGVLVARSYIEGKHYGGDVENLAEVAVPNYGGVSVYCIWEGADILSKWRSTKIILRFYQYRDQKFQYSLIDSIHTYFPSVKDILPTYPAINHKGSFIAAESSKKRNDNLIYLDKHLDTLYDRVAVHTLLGNEISTPVSLTVGEAGKNSWVDGVPVGEAHRELGDGTVPVQSSSLEGDVNGKTVATDHGAIIGVANVEIIRKLYSIEPVEKFPWSELMAKSKSFLFDCPIKVIITLPDGSQKSMERPDDDQENQDLGTIGEVMVSPELLWLQVPVQKGKYVVDITALEDTPVRWWVDDDEIKEFSMVQGERKLFEYEDVSNLPVISITATTILKNPPSSPSSLVMALESPSPSASSSPNILSTTQEAIKVKKDPQQPVKVDLSSSQYLKVATEVGLSIYAGEQPPSLNHVALACGLIGLLSLITWLLIKIQVVRQSKVCDYNK